MNLIKKILLVLLIVFIAIQFIQPAWNTNGQVLPTDISKTVYVPQNVQSLLQIACYDCHSNNTIYPWYAYMQPIGWILANHIKNGKKELNFSDFGSYSIRKQQSKLKAIADQIKDGEMPPCSYTIIHKNARLSKEQKALIVDWAEKAQDSLSQKNP
ncbi:MAG TPA: heme-binding domain-containing protein [Hanamia sp.]